MTSARPATIAAAVALCTCSSTDPHATPEAAVRAFTAAVNRDDVRGLRAVALSPERLKRAVSCPDGNGRMNLVEIVASAHQSLDDRRGMRIRHVEIAELSRRVVAVGDDYRDCRATEPFELRRLRMQLSIDDGGAGSEAGYRNKTEEGDVIRLDGRWWLVIPS